MSIVLHPFSALFSAALICMATDARPQAVPDLYGMTLAQAEDRLSRLGLSTVVEREDSALRRDTILRQIPGEGGSAGEGDLVIVWVSNGLVLPDGIVGRSPESARAELQGMGAAVQVTTRDVVNSGDNRVIEVASMAPGDRFDATIDALTLVVSNEIGVKVPNLKGANRAQMQDLLQPLDLKLDYQYLSHPPSPDPDPCWGWAITDNGRTVSPEEGKIVPRGTVIKVRYYEIWSPVPLIDRMCNLTPHLESRRGGIN